MEVENKYSSGSGLGIAGLILGILSIPLGIMGCTFPFGLVLGIMGITLTAVGITQARKTNSASSILLAGLVVSIIGTSFAFIRLTGTLSKKPLSKIEIIREHLHKSKDFTHEMDENIKDAFEEEWNSSDEEELRKTLEDLERDINSTLEDKQKQLDDAMKNLDEKEKAERIGRAAGRALRSFVDELNDTTSNK